MDQTTSKSLGLQSAEDLKNFNLGQPPEDWSGWFSYMALKLVLYVAKNPWEFLTSTLIILTPLMLICAYCSYKLPKKLNLLSTSRGNKLKWTKYFKQIVLI
ncbi:unnamed protein product [Heterobilharzia americana]|nr:unnamed protein product [Heterobilharzia americana]